jgi:aldose 1-epimerase
MRIGRQAIVVFAAGTLSLAGCKQASTPEPTPSSPTAQTTPQIGGQDVVKLSRKATANGTKPEFLSATILPGRGMNLFQITAFLPGKGEIPIFASPSLEEAASKFNGDMKEFKGNQSFLFGGAFLVPYPNRIRGKLSEDKKTITTEWHGKTLNLPANWKDSKNPNGELHAMHGLILDHQTEAVTTHDEADGQTVTGTIHAGNFGGHWVSDTDLNFTISLKGDAVETTITAKNVGQEPEPMAIGWHPYFALPSGDRKQAKLHIPGDKRAEVNNYGDVFPTGRILTVTGTPYDFTAPEGRALDDIFLDDNFMDLKRENGNAVVNVIDPAANYGVHIIGLSPEIKSIQVYAPKDKSFIAVEQQFNYGDPFGKEWKGIDTGMVTLQPGQSVTWKVRLELYTPGK